MRQPKTTVYQGEINIVAVEGTEEEHKEDSVDRLEFSDDTMEDIIHNMHGFLNMWDTITKVLMVRPSVKFLKENAKNRPRVFELDDEMVRVIRDDLEKAKLLFAPINQTVRVTPVPPRLEKESENAVGQK